MDLNFLKNAYRVNKEMTLCGRYISYESVLPLLLKHGKHFQIETIGHSVLDRDIHAIKFGNGPKKIMLWSQMHGNETTTTKAIFDLLNAFSKDTDDITNEVMEKCTIAIIPMLNPDGANAYTRLNANQIDLNRDAQERSQPESMALRSYFDMFKPDFCFNLHGQRTIFSAGKTIFPATVSFLAPDQDDNRSITETRKKAMEIIVAMNKNLQLQIPNQVGVYDDSFNLNCVGDTFQSLEVPTVLFEAGHFAKDYDREVVREFMFQSLFVALHYIACNTISGKGYLQYMNIPQNEKMFFDIIIRNALINNKIEDIAIQFYEKLDGKDVKFCPIVEKISNLDNFNGHRQVDANGCRVLTISGEPIYVGYENDFALINNEQFALKP